MGKVDLGLQEAQGSFSPSNPIVPLILPSSASEPIGIGNDGLSLMPEGASSDATARVFDEEALFLPDAFADTSLLLSPVSGGVELSAMLASPASPEQIAFAVSLPKNAQLRASEEGGAEVIGPDGEVLYLISPPRALDAQGTTVPVSLEVQSDSVILNMPHRQLDLAYPLYVDPEVIENWSGFADTSKLNYWSWQYSGVPSAETYIGQRWPIVDNWGNGLYVRSRSETSYPAGSWGRWWLSPPGSTSYMRRVILGPIHYDAHGCTANEPHPYVGVWNDYSGWKALSNAYPTSWGNWIDTGEGNLGAGTRTAFVGIEAAGAVNLKCGHDYALNGATLYLTDPENPTLGSVAGLPGGWFNDSSPFTVNVPVNDPGLGVKQATLSGAGAVPQEQKLGCSGTFASPCPPSYTFPFTFSAKSLDEGEKNVQISGKDVLDKYSNTLTLTSKVDRSEPVVNLNGQLAEATDETEGDEKDTTGIDPLSLPVYNLNIEATDGSITADPKTKRSGVKSIEVFLDEEKVPKEAWSNASCPQSSCSLAPTFVLKLNTLVALSTHTLHVVVRDFAGNQRTRNVGFRYVPATGIKDDYIMQHFPLDDGTGNEAEEEDPRRPELAVNLMNGNLVYRERDVDVPGPAVDLEVERFYNSLLPDSQNSEWGDGWTLGQTPTLEPEESGTPPTEATMVRTSGVVQSAVQLPTKVEGEHFDPQLHAVVTKEPGGGYEVTDASGESESSLDFNAAGQMTEMRTPGYASIDYGYEAGDLDEIAVDDPASAPMSAEVLDNLREEPTEWSLQTTPNPTPPKTNAELTDVACSSATACLAVGYDNANGRGLAEFWNGTTWTQKSGSAGRRQKAVACGAPEKCWVLATTSSGLSRAELWEGGSWEEVEAAPATPTGGSSVTLNAISCTAALTCTAVGSYVKESKTLPLIERLNNYSFSVQTPTTTTTSSLKDVSCVSATECVAIGSGGGKLFAERWNGTSWTTTAAPPNPAPYMPTYTTLTDLSCASSTSCVAIGSFTPDKEGEEFRWFADRWNGSTWSASGTGATGGEALNDITCTSSTSCIATGTESGKTLVKTWNGTSWSTQTSPNPSGKTPVLSAISCTTPISCTIAGRATGGGEVVTLAGRTVLRPEPTPEADPSVDISVSGGLVQALGGDESGEHDYQHSGNLLTAHEAPNGDYAYAYDASKRMTKVTLPNGTYAEVAYEPAYGRVKSVTVAPKGSNPKTTYFNYEDAPQRRTTVTPPIPSPVTTYEFGPNGGAIEWWNTVEPPGIHLAGDLADIQGRETVAPIAVGVHSLEVKGHSEEGIASIQIVANNNVLLSEQTCAQVPGPPVECVDKSDEWVTETGNWPPGILYLEAIVTDARGGKASERFWVNIPYTPPPESETDEPPKFEDILHFREEFGLDLDIQDDEQAINNRIFDLMGAWDNPLTSAGEVARATEARWGVPMRAVDAGEMEYREQYVDQAATALPQWAEHHAATSAYAGYYVDHRAGGVLYVGFTSNQEALVNELQKSGELIAPARIKGFPTHPTQSLPDLNALQVAVSEDSEPGGRLSRVGIEVAQNKVSVGTPEPGAVKSALLNQFGASAPLDVYEESKGIGPKGTYRERASGPVKAGDLLRSEVPVVQECTTGFGAWDSSGTNPSGQAIFRQFILTAGHCFAEGAPVINWKLSPDGKTEIGKRELGYVRRRTYLTTGGGFMVDAEAARLNSPAFVPRLIYYSANQSIRIDSAVSPKLGMVLCFSGNVSNHVKCGRVLGPPEAFSYYEDGPEAPMMWQVPFSVRSLHGDSGAPVWEAGSGHAVGLLTSGVEPKHVGELGPEIADVTPLLPSPGHPAAPGVLNAEGSSSGGSLGLVQWKP